MRTSPARVLANLRELSLNRRVAGFFVAIAINALLLLMLLTLSSVVTVPKPDDAVNVFNVVPPPPPPPPPAPNKIVVKRVFREGHSSPPVPPPPAPTTSLADLGVIQMTHSELAQVDNAMKAPPVDRPVRDSTPTVRMANSDTPEAPGKGPHGETLYAENWVRKPTFAEVDPYMPSNTQVGDWGEIACRTAPRNHLEDCVALAESPVGSGIARGAVNAAWQYLMRPPRLGGRDIIGAWVRLKVRIVESQRGDVRRKRVF